MQSQVALGSITMNKASGGDGIPVELFQILEDDPIKVLHSLCQQIWKTQQQPQEKVSFHSNLKEGQCQRLFNYQTITFTSHARKVLLKIVQARFQKCVYQELPDAQDGFRKGRGILSFC